MTTILRSDLFRNFMGGFVLGAIALFALQPEDGRANAAAETTTMSESITSR